MQSTVEAVNGKLYRQIPAKQLCTTNEFSQCSVWQNGSESYCKLVELLDAWQDWRRSAIACSVELAQS